MERWKGGKKGGGFNCRSQERENKEDEAAEGSGGRGIKKKSGVMKRGEKKRAR